MSGFWDLAASHWPVWLVSVTLIVAAVIDGVQLKVPNWLTYPMIATGWAYSLLFGGFEGLGWSLAGTVVGLVLLLIVYCIGGMGAGDVKLLAGIGAWMQVEHTMWVFAYTAILGGVFAVAMVWFSGKWKKHVDQFQSIASEIVTVRNPDRLFENAAERKPRMMLLPYGVPMTCAALAYFAASGLLW